jgi:adenine-specific DNA-methyltransferase
VIPDATLYHGDAADLLGTLPDGDVDLVITSPPYNLGKEYERRAPLDDYLDEQGRIIEGIDRVLSPRGSVCWQVGNFVRRGEVFPLDVLFYPAFRRLGYRLRNRIVWRFGHGLHASRRFSGRYEVLLWFTKGDDYTFNLDPVRVPSKYPAKKHFKGPKKGQLSGNPLGKNPSDVWDLLASEWEEGAWDIPNVGANHPEKTAHPCQFPVELAERCVLALSDPGDLVLDPYAGVGSSLIAALMHGRRALGSEREGKYVDIFRDRHQALRDGTLRTRPLGKPIHQPTPSGTAA